MRHQYHNPSWIMIGMGSCPYCKKALRLLNRHYGKGSGRVVDVLHDHPERGTWESDFVEESKARRMTVPQVFILNTSQPNSYIHVGGYTDLCNVLGERPE